MNYKPLIKSKTNTLVFKIQTVIINLHIVCYVFQNFISLNDKPNKLLLMKNAKLLNRDAQKSIMGSAAGLVCCERDDNGKCTLWIGPGQHCP